MTILVIGKQGQVAQCFAAAGRRDVVCLGRPEIDLTTRASVQEALRSTRPSIVINAAAYTSVDRAQSETEAAYALNRDGPAELAQLCAMSAIPLIHLSTDCVFDGGKTEPYEPDDRAEPLSVYGLSKLQGEQAVARLCPQHLNVRVSWVFSEYARSFVRMMLTRAQTEPDLTAINDQIGCPTYGPDLAAGLLKMADAAVQPGFADWGTYHLTGTEALDRASMSEAIFAVSRALGGPVARVEGVRTADYPTPARRPLNCRLGSAKAFDRFDITMPDWKIGLERSVRVLVSEMNAGSKG